MKILLWSILLIGCIVAGNCNIGYIQSKQDVVDLLESVKSDKAGLEAERNSQMSFYKYFTELADQTLSNMTDKLVAAEKKINELPDPVMEFYDEWLAVTNDIVAMKNSITKYHNIGKVEDQRIRNLIYAVFQCYDYDPRLPDAIAFVENVYASILGGRKKLELAQIPEIDLEFSREKIIQFFHISHMVRLKDNEQHLKEEIKAKWDVAYGRVDKALDVIMNMPLPIDTEERLNQALLNLAELYRQKHRLRRFIDPREDPDNPRHIAAGDRKIDEILLPVPKKKIIHSEL